MKKNVKQLIDRFGYRIVSAPVDMEDDFLVLHRRYSPNTLLEIEGLYCLYKSIEYICRARIPGDVVQCGVWKGGSAQLLAAALQHFTDELPHIYLYDTFAGMTMPGVRDQHGKTGRPAFETWRKNRRESHNDWIYSPIEEAASNMGLTSYPPELVHFVQGKIEETVPGNAPGTISLLHLDTDWYESTKHELEHLYPRLAKGGVLIVDDYGGWTGARAAVDEYFSSSALMLHRIDWSVRAAVKP